jgi:high-affinity nickel-transport protein
MLRCLQNKTTSSSARRNTVLVLGGLLLLNVVLWGLTLMVFSRFPLLLGTATLAYTFGLRHALDADHISAIDNVTRKLMHDGKRPLCVGLFFSLGHSTIVICLSVVIALTTSQIQQHFPEMQRVGGIIGASFSTLFLLLIAFINLSVLYEIVRTFSRLKENETVHDHGHHGGGFMTRILRPVLRVADQSWKMYFVGFLFGLGFDTATEVGLLGISATTATQGLPIWSILLFPALFTAGMCLLDTADGILMLRIYQWASLHPARKLYYNLTITSISVLVAVAVAGIQALRLISDHLDLRGPLWDAVGNIGDHPERMGILIIGIFVASWAVSVLLYRRMRERAAGATVPAEG